MLRSLAAMTLFAALGAAAALAETPSLDSVLACRAIEDPMERVACYDTAVGRLGEAQAAGEVTIISRADVERVQRESFGFRIPSLPSFASRDSGGREEKLEQVTEPVRSVSTSGGRLRVTLETGAVWVQIDDKNIRARNPKSAEISQAALGSFKMKLDGGLAFRVRREN